MVFSHPAAEQLAFDLDQRVRIWDDLLRIEQRVALTDHMVGHNRQTVDVPSVLFNERLETIDRV